MNDGTENHGSPADTGNSTVATGGQRILGEKKRPRPRGTPWLWTAAAAWLAANLWIGLAPGSRLPFDWPARAELSKLEILAEINLAMAQIVLLMGVVYLLTRRRPDPLLSRRAPEHRRALAETLGLLGYGVLGMMGGYFLATALGWHPFGLHLAGTLFGTRDLPAPGEVLTWAGYNLLVYAVLPLLWFRRRYSSMALGLRSTAPRNDLLVIGVVLALEFCFQVVFVQPASLGLPPHLLVPGAALTFVLYLAGAVFPAMIYVYAILIPRFLRLTGSATATVLLGGVTYAGLHFWDAWAVFSSLERSTLSVVFLLFTYLGPGMFKSFLTLRTGNAWVHVWAYHAFAPHTLIDTPHIVEVFRLK
ncbi:hypothetical protein [Arthrobacter sp. 7Tela_A1]|uniref:hypothetical protein n=1 Tax=Arthrobacter sp. 7Tela_A1 TaxID=3093745 RepID=UPI003BB55BD3